MLVKLPHLGMYQYFIHMFMPSKLNKVKGLPIIEDRYNEHSRKSSLSKLSSELGTIAFVQGQESKNKHRAKKLRRAEKILTEPDDRRELQDYKGEIRKLRTIILEKNLQRSLMIEDKMRRISQLSTESVTRSMESPRSAVNYISLSPHSGQSPLNHYPQPYPQPMPSLPYIQNYPYIPYPSPPMAYPYERERQSYYRPRQRDKTRQREFRVPFEENYDQFQQPTRYKKMRDAKTKKKPNIFIAKKLREKLRKKWRSAVWAIVFSLCLIPYGKKIMVMRQSIFQKFQGRKFNIEMTMFQKYMVKKCKPFFMFIANNKNFDLSLAQGETQRMETQKAQTTRRLISMLVDGLGSIKAEETNEPATSPIELIYIFCRHGAYVNQFMTEEELDVVCFSEKSKYLRLDRNMEICQIINFVCNKILLYNSILNPAKVDAKLFPPEDELANKNFYFLGSIWYELCLELQDEYLCQVPQTYDIGNWRKLKGKFSIQPAKSLTVNGSPKQEDQIISGLLGKKKVEQLFGANFWRKQKTNLKNALEHVHQLISEFHQKVKQKIKF